MSKMGQFVYAVQEVVCDYYNEPFEVVEERVRESFKNEPKYMQDYAVQTAREEYDTIFSDFDEFSRLMYASGE